MTTEAKDLSAEQQELVAVAASVGAGCQPCVSHHLKAGAKAGLEDEELLAAVTSAERVSAEATVAMGDHVRAKLGPGVSSSALLPRLEEALASLGAALGANDARNIERQLRAAAELGASRSQLQQAIETAHTVQENAARIHLREAKRRLDTIAPPLAAESETQSAAGCGCGSDDQTHAAPTETPEPATATSDKELAGTSGCRSLAGSFGAISDCRELVERFIGGAAPATTTEAPAATAAGACTKEAGR